MRLSRIRIWLATSCLGVLLISSIAGKAQTSARPQTRSAPQPAATAPVAPNVPEASKAPVILQGRTLFDVQSRLYTFSPEERAQAISERLNRLLSDARIPVASIHVQEQEGEVDIVAGDLLLMSVTEADAQAASRTRQELAGQYAKSMIATIQALRDEFSWNEIVMASVWAGISTIIFLLLLMGMRKLRAHLYRKILASRGLHIKPLRFRKLVLVDESRIAAFLASLVRLIHVGALLVLTYLYVPLVLNFFPWTRGYATVLFEYILQPVRMIFVAIGDYLPDLFVVIVICVAAHYLLKIVSFLFHQISAGNLEIPNFYPEWAQPTYKLVRFLILAFSAVVLFPYLPGSSSPAFQGVSLFLGLLLSLGSTSVVSNIVSGTLLTYTRAFQIGDRVKIGDAQGDVTERTMLVTRIRTIKNEDISIPNALVLNTPITNFSATEREAALILHTTVTIGYDAPWRKVHELLIAAANASDGILKDPAPFVLQTSLDDFFVSYQINAYTKEARRMAMIYSNLHQNIQDKFNEGGVEIMSPHYSSLRDGNQITIPPDQLPASYSAPAFRVRTQAEPDKE